MTESDQLLYDEFISLKEHAQTNQRLAESSEAEARRYRSLQADYLRRAKELARQLGLNF